ncbi:hypothetical protein CXR27_05935 [Brevibacterium aurantiacum]|uniref:Uncharacterized protein n=4 Tax=Brevibacterium TaxID=1696 RepID=A0A3Q9NSQ3_BREAU|nr:hypothetical protein CXR23_06110 [Brevibacterium aurantiacum]AZT96594.1 hypothetical protein CXR27_05935 [Brevibacterium aurantiacum]
MGMSKKEHIVIRVNATDFGIPMSFDQWLNRGRRWWKTRADRALNADRLFVIDATNRVRAVGLVDGVLKDREDGSDRVSIEVTSEEDSELIGKIIRRNDSRNPISYVTTIEVVDQ